MLVLQLMVKRLSAKDIYQTLAHGARSHRKLATHLHEVVLQAKNLL